MKRIKSLICLSLMIVMGGQLVAQTHGTMFLGASFPKGDFSMVNGYSSTAIFGNEDQTFGGAGLGFNAGLKWDFGVGVPGLAVLLSVDGFYNGPSADMKDCYKDLANGYDLLFDNVEQSTSRYINVPAMLGLRYTYYLNPQFGLFVEGGAGGDARFITNHQVKYTDLLGTKHIDTEKFNTTIAFAWQAGLGIEVSRNLVLGCSFYDLGKSEVEGEVTTMIGSESATSDFKRGTLKTTMLLARIGFKF